MSPAYTAAGCNKAATTGPLKKSHLLQDLLKAARKLHHGKRERKMSGPIGRNACNRRATRPFDANAAIHRTCNTCTHTLGRVQVLHPVHVGEEPKNITLWPAGHVADNGGGLSAPLFTPKRTTGGAACKYAGPYPRSLQRLCPLASSCGTRPWPGRAFGHLVYGRSPRYLPFGG